jgi:dolichol-phosphate mannosyltransferase
MNESVLKPPEGPLVVPALAQSQSGGVWFSLTVPTYNEGENLRELIAQVTATLDERYGGRYEIIIVDDNSTDDTQQVMSELMAAYPQLKFMVRTSERGLATAVVRGWQAAAGAVFGVMDGDLQHPVAVLPNLLKAVEDGSDVVVASRYVEHGGVGDWGFMRRMISRIAALMAEVILPEAAGRVKDPGSGYFALKRSVVEGVNLAPKGYKILLEVLARCRVSKVTEVAFEFDTRKRGQTKATMRQFVEYLQQLVELRMSLWLNKRTGDDG